MCGPGRAGPRGLVSWLQSSLQIITDKTAPANISEDAFPYDSRLINRESYITLSHMLGRQPIYSLVWFYLAILLYFAMYGSCSVHFFMARPGLPKIIVVALAALRRALRLQLLPCLFRRVLPGAFRRLLMQSIRSYGCSHILCKFCSHFLVWQARAPGLPMSLT